MKDFVREKLHGYSAKTAPYSRILTQMEGYENTWTDLTIPSMSVLKNFVRSELNNAKADAERALERQGKRCYIRRSIMWLRNELKNRGIDYGQKRE